jgi:hypothetical protein
MLPHSHCLFHDARLIIVDSALMLNVGYGSDLVASIIANNGGQSFVYGLISPRSPSIVHDATTTIINAPLTLCSPSFDSQISETVAMLLQAFLPEKVGNSLTMS